MFGACGLMFLLIPETWKLEPGASPGMKQQPAGLSKVSNSNAAIVWNVELGRWDLRVAGAEGVDRQRPDPFIGARLPGCNP